MINKDLVRKYALQNAAKFSGKANIGAVIGKVLSERPELKAKIKELSRDISAIVSQVNALSVEAQVGELQKIAPELLEKKEKKKRELPPLKNAQEGKVVTRMPPEPSKYAHIGHALSFLINYMYAQKYSGKCVYRLEDTNPLKAEKEFYSAMEEDIKWLGINYSKKVIVSEDIEKFYAYAKKLISKGDAYVCFCEREKMGDYRHKAKICECREFHPEKNLEEWQKMLKGNYDEGACVLRLKGRMDDPNHVMRDPVIFRICKHPHPLQGTKFKVWPMYDFENAVEEELCGVTHVIRSDEFGTMRVELQNYIKELLGFKKQEVLQYSRFNIAGAVTKGREIREKIEKGEAIGWDDPSLVTLKALRRRGIVPETFYELAIEVGLSNATTNIDFSVVEALNRKILDPKVNRYFFVDEPKKLVIKNAPKIIAKAPLHPDFPEKGCREIKTDGEFYISDELEKGKMYRLMHLFNFKDGKFVSEDYDPKLEAKLIHWVPAKENIEIEILLPNKELKKGLAEKNVLNIKVGEVVQFERRFFTKLDEKKGDKLKFWFTHH
ncbi:glutamate--tRNA ligase [Candidatus Woesearchaeota archaeon]|nr:glutamate--tRNA ligase [Candidatus Woesearchaeota archaeon]